MTAFDPMLLEPFLDQVRTYIQYSTAHNLAHTTSKQCSLNTQFLCFKNGFAFVAATYSNRKTPPITNQDNVNSNNRKHIIIQYAQYCTFCIIRTAQSSVVYPRIQILLANFMRIRIRIRIRILLAILMQIWIRNQIYLSL
jgi:hypothetical protein